MALSFLMKGIVVYSFLHWPSSAQLLPFFENIRTCDIQLQLKRETYLKSNFLLRNEIMIVHASQWLFQNTWNLGELSENQGVTSEGTDFPFRFRDKFLIVIVEDYIHAKEQFSQGNVFEAHPHCKSRQVVYILFVSYEQINPSELFRLINILRFCNILTLLMLHENKYVQSTGLPRVYNGILLFFICQFCPNYFNRGPYKADWIYQFKGSVNLLDSTLTKDTLREIRNAYLNRLHGSPVVIHRNERCGQDHGYHYGFHGSKASMMMNKLLICDPLNMFAHIAIKKLNFTPQWLDYGGLLFLHYTKIERRLGTVSEKSAPKISSSTFSVFLRKTKEYFVIYCETEVYKPSSSLSYWLNMFSYDIWILILLSFLVTSLVSTKLKIGNELSAALLQMMGYAFRQNMRWKHKIHIYISAGCIVLSLTYEAAITSQVIKPLTETVYQTVQDLIEAGYKFLLEPVEIIPEIFFVYVKRDHLANPTARKYGVYHELLNGLRFRNVTSEKRGTLVEIFENQTLGGCGTTRSSCMNNDKFNLAMHFESKLTWSELLEMKYVTAASKFCHMIPEVLSKVSQGWVIRYVFHEEFSTLLHSMLDYGFMEMWERNHEWLMNYKKIVRIPNIYARLTSINSWKGLTMSGHVSHLFMIYAVLAIVTLLVFMFENLFQQNKYKDVLFN